ncbi:hypothetical protein [Gordonia sp. NB41Y]|uniref:hypothetical protein n=1 Tax=Gordonia sp. NB41Y TaxID=875808 RepID=UPI00273B3D70|nr:hypothetical protein [Gordonia sp. NB41Y]WLP92153.1 hypothetical protein Q9K23_07960 [Gordonia sp. NB41Y]
MTRAGDDYLAALTTLVEMPTRVQEQKAEVDRIAAERISVVDADGRRTRSQYEALDSRRNQVQRDVAALSRDVGGGAPPAGGSPAPVRLSTTREIEAALSDMAARTRQVRQNWDWAQRYRQRAAQQPAPPPPPRVVAPPPPPPAPVPPPVPARRQLPPWAIAALAAALLAILVLIVVLVL